jgi:CheY-like chemotaxis protein
MQVTNDPSPRACAPLRRKVLVINDSPTFLDLMREILEVEGGYEVATLDQSDGVIVGADGRAPDLIVLDVAFRQGSSGLEVAERLSSAAETASIPVLFCTALREQDIDEQARALLTARNQRILYKPFDVDQMLQQVNELLAEHAPPAEEPAHQA